jgi:uncharacterized protein DUF1259
VIVASQSRGAEPNSRRSSRGASWLAFRHEPSRFLGKGGIEQSALHNQLFGESPDVMYVHFMGHGDASKLARALHDALAVTKTPMEPPPAPPATPPAIDLPAADLDHIIGHPGKIAAGTYQFMFARAEKIVDHGVESRRR